jgi:hypothetical protein
MKTLALIASILAILSGLGLIFTYLFEVWQVLEQADQSIIFWYLPMVFLGLFFILAGISGMLWSKKR